MFKTIDRDELNRRIQSIPAPVLLEALPERYFAQKHLPGAKLFPHDQVERLAPTVVPDKSVEIVVYCASRTCQNSHMAAYHLIRLGYTNVAVYEGGKQDWEEGGFAFESTDVCALADSFIVVTEPDVTSFYQDRNLLRRIGDAGRWPRREAGPRGPLLAAARVGTGTRCCRRSAAGRRPPP